MDKEEFSNWLIGEMNARGWSQSDLARKSGLSRQTISLYINQEINQPDANSFMSLARVFNKPIEHVMSEAGMSDYKTKDEME